MPPIIIVFLKWPELGKVKTRLAAAVGDEEAARIYRALVRQVGRCLLRCSCEEHLAVCFAPAAKGAAIRDWIEDEAFPDCTIQHWWPQPETDLGGRQAHALSRAFELGYKKAALIGTDCVDLEPEIFAKAWKALDHEADWVFGPANDGGYYLGATKPGPATPKAAFEDVRWSTEHTLKDCKTRIQKAEGRIFTLETLVDIDDYSDWQKVKDRVI